MITGWSLLHPCGMGVPPMRVARDRRIICIARYFETERSNAWAGRLMIIHILECDYYLLLFLFRQFFYCNSHESFRHISQCRFKSVVTPVPRKGRRLVCERPYPMRTPPAGLLTFTRTFCSPTRSPVPAFGG
jgi:hypothetical protein